MNFSDYLFFTKRLTCEQYMRLRLMQVPDAYNGAYEDAATRWVKKCRFQKDLATIEDLTTIRRRPFGSILDIEKHALAKMVEADPNVSIDSLVKEWMEWHFRNMEPICSYSLATKIGRELYSRQVEKKIVGRFVAKNLMKNADLVAIAEGSSAAYAGLAIGLFHKGVRVTTSNDPLLREFRDNSVLEDNLAGVDAIGGELEKLTGHGGVAGKRCKDQYTAAFGEDPPATVVIMAVTGFLSDRGPFAYDPPTRQLKKHIIDSALREDIRSVVFVTDYSKHLPSKSASYDTPIYDKHEWSQLLEKHLEKIFVVTAPPPKLRARINTSAPFNAYHRSTIAQDYSLDPEGSYEFSQDEFIWDFYEHNLLEKLNAAGVVVPQLRTELESLNSLLHNASLSQTLANVSLPREGQILRKRAISPYQEQRLNAHELIQLNRLILEAAFPEECPMKRPESGKPCDIEEYDQEAKKLAKLMGTVTHPDNDACRYHFIEAT